MGPKELAALMLSNMTGGDSVAQAVEENRCVMPAIGCGQPVAPFWPSRAYEEEWKMNGLCAPCQDKAQAEEL